ncbi:hypothetical protein J7E25_01870 [Agromyces sp. ISL-38]|uniref:hypothetical protein n=1 Tax=Agromyces sp. ISL-38 TaxID=2819107 RepID=UPI001BE7170D|nr:hypothetical protein [Agromyces sp. ISL-38]MBT2497834.1 hypothetical protein [Agromyces sp. ISL-38]
MKRFFRRLFRRRTPFKPFDRAALPKRPTPSFDEMLAEGVLVAESAGRMALKNRLIVFALRGEERFEPARAMAMARDVLYELVQEADEAAERAAAERESASQREGRSAHQHDYHRADTVNLRHRERVYAGVAKRLWELREDPAYLERLTEHARDAAWEDIAAAIDARLAREWPDIAVDAEYELARDERTRELLVDLERDLREADAERARRADAGDAFRDFVG